MPQMRKQPIRAAKVAITRPQCFRWRQTVSRTSFRLSRDKMTRRLSGQIVVMRRRKSVCCRWASGASCQNRVPPWRVRVSSVVVRMCSVLGQMSLPKRNIARLLREGVELAGGSFLDERFPSRLPFGLCVAICALGAWLPGRSFLPPFPLSPLFVDDLFTRAVRRT